MTLARVWFGDVFEDCKPFSKAISTTIHIPYLILFVVVFQIILKIFFLYFAFSFKRLLGTRAVAQW